MTNPNMKYQYMCIKPDVTIEYYYDNLKKSWEYLIDQFSQNTATSGNLSALLLSSRIFNNQNIKTIFNSPNPEREIQHLVNDTFQNKGIEQVLANSLAERILQPDISTDFVMSPKVSETINSLAKLLGKACYPQVIDIIVYMGRKYRQKYRQRFENMPPERAKQEISNTLLNNYEYIKRYIKENSYRPRSLTQFGGEDTSAEINLESLQNFSIESELENLIPNELGSLKQFFIKIITTYYDNLHPIVWAQIYRYFIDNFFIELPLTKDDLFAFASKSVLLNSGPYILKMLQMIRPVLTKEILTKYNLTKLSYPLMTPEQVNLILSKVVKDWDMYKVLAHISASVGQVAKVMRVDRPNDVFIIKMIKPIAMAQSCWEYETLKDTFDRGSCEEEFLLNVLESNGKELNANNEIENLNEAEKVYNATYKEVFGKDLPARISSVKNIPGIIKEDCWFALTMTFAKGIGLNKLVEKKELEKDTPYRANLHRCLDLLVYTFFQGIIKNGYGHSDTHAGNLIFSFQNHTLTMIDFGSVLRIQLKSDPTLDTIAEALIMSIYYNYGQMLDTMTKLLNSKCVSKDPAKSTEIDMNSPDYQDFRRQLVEYKYHNTKISAEENKKTKQYIEDLFSDQRIQQELAFIQQDKVKEKAEEIEKQEKREQEKEPSVYSYLNIKPKPEEVIVENREVLPEFTKVGKSEGYSLNFVIQEIIKFYARNGVNIAIKFAELNDALKAYTLLIGVLEQTHYSGYRMAYILKQAVINWENIPSVLSIAPTLLKIIHTQSNEYDEYKKGVVEGKITEEMPEGLPKEGQNGQKGGVNMVTFKDFKDKTIYNDQPTYQNHYKELYRKYKKDYKSLKEKSHSKNK
jgi:hypothetical protein